jgi:heme/copper-type cytochrome/quinol oxidase subunit 4
MNDPQNAGGILAAILGIYMIVFVVFLAVIIIPFWFILKKAGFSSWLSLINILAFAEWKVIPAPQVTWQPPLPPQV